MNRAKREFNIFNLSFLDIISCGFGAVVMLILISRPSEEPVISVQEEGGNDAAELALLSEEINLLADQVREVKAKQELLADDANKLQGDLEGYSKELKDKRQQDQEVQESLEGLALVQESLQRAAIRPKSKTPVTKRDEEVGGIPVDSDYVVFVIDTSGSMKEIWPQVSRQVIEVLNIHPQVKSFQILNDLGKSIIRAYEGRWIPDTPARRNAVIKVFNRWAGASNSSPIEGVERALKHYAKPNLNTSIYVFGDDYTGGSYDPQINRLTRLNNSRGKQLARIHAVGFLSPGTTGRYSILMRELSRRNGGTFLALPP